MHTACTSSTLISKVRRYNDHCNFYASNLLNHHITKYANVIIFSLKGEIDFKISVLCTKG